MPLFWSFDLRKCFINDCYNCTRPQPCHDLLRFGDTSRGHSAGEAVTKPPSGLGYLECSVKIGKPDRSFPGDRELHFKLRVHFQVRNSPVQQTGRIGNARTGREQLIHQLITPRRRHTLEANLNAPAFTSMGLCDIDFGSNITLGTVLEPLSQGTT